MRKVFEDDIVLGLGGGEGETESEAFPELCRRD
jgi:hypothetical protein